MLFNYRRWKPILGIQMWSNETVLTLIANWPPKRTRKPHSYTHSPIVAVACDKSDLLMMAMLVSKLKFCNLTKSDLFELISIFNVGLRPLGCVGLVFCAESAFLSPYGPHWASTDVGIPFFRLRLTSQATSNIITSGISYFDFSWRHPRYNSVALIRVIAIWELILVDVTGPRSRVTDPIKKLLLLGDCFNWICELSGWKGAHFLRDEPATTIGEGKIFRQWQNSIPADTLELDTKTCSHDFIYVALASRTFSWAVAKEPATLSLHNFMLSRHM